MKIFHPPQGPASDSHLPPAETATLQMELAGTKDDYVQLAADFARFKARTRRDAEGQARAEKDAFIRELLPVVDNLERALSPESAISAESLHRGVELTLQQFDALLRRNGVEATEDIGLPFDPHRQEAISVWHDPSQPDQQVLAVLERGYRRGDELFRPARVIVNDLGEIPAGEEPVERG